MAGAFGRRRGGICGLLSLPREEWEAIESTLLARGFTLADVPHRVTWRALVAMLRWPWDHREYLLADVVDLLAILTWQPTEAGHKGINPPGRLPRPGEVARRAAEAESLMAAAREQGWMD